MSLDRSDTTADFAASMRRDLQSGIPAYVILASAKRHLMSLRVLKKDLVDRDQAIADYLRFIGELERRNG